METLLFLAILGGFIWIFTKGQRKRKRVFAATEAVTERYRDWQLFVSSPIIDRAMLAVSASERRIALGPVEDPVDVAWSDISRVEVERNGGSLTTTNRGSQLTGAAVGSVLLGPMGMLMGGLSGSKATRERVNELALRIMVEHPTRPVYRIVFFSASGKGIAASSLGLRAPGEKLDHFHALLVNAMRSVEQAQVRPAEPPQTVTAALPSAPSAPVEQRLAQLWQLHQSGALSAEEFAEHKAQILARPGA